MKIIPGMLTLALLLCFGGCTLPQRASTVIEEDIAGSVLKEDIFDPAQAEVFTSQWPEDLLPAIIPEYTSGSIVGYSGIQSALSITIADTTEEDVNAYRQSLQNSAFALSENQIATKDDIEVSIDFLEISQSAIISITYTDSEIWPAEMMMDVPVLDYGVVAYLDTTNPDLIFIRMKYLSQKHAQLWFDTLESEGFVKTAQGYTRDDAVITLTDYNQGEWDIQIALSQSN